MKQSSVVTTNLRISKALLQSIRVRAAEEGISANEYMTRVIKEKLWEEQFLPKKDRAKIPRLKKKKQHFIQSMLELAKQPNHPEEQYLSEDDKIIYGL
ncbi:MAG: hypothetical protein N3A54_07370 [Patescibacteria group bacterium]|nr:hypothetical protein [Patescibacteria group bacterium]